MREPARPTEPTTGGQRRPVLRFVLVFAASLLLFQLLFAIAGSAPFDAYLALCARAAGHALTWIGSDVVVQGNRLAVDGATFEVSAACSGLQPLAMLAIAMLAFPSSWRARASGLAAGALVVLALNLVRIASLCWIEVRWPASFELFHLPLWPVALILGSIALRSIWARSTVRP